MIDYINEYLFRKDSIKKSWTIFGDNINLTNADLYSESVKLEEVISPDTNVFFGNCPASVFRFTTSAVSTSFKDKEIIVSIVLDDDDENPFTLGTYIVTEETLSADKTQKDVVAYDSMYKIINTNVAGWYDGLTFPMTLASFRNSLFAFMGISQETTTLVNDSVIVEKTIDADVISGAEVLKAICEINGVFGHINRENVFEYKTLSDSVDYTITASMYGSCVYADYEVENITQLQIREESGDIGVIVGESGNAYIVEDNFLVYGKTPQEMTTIATNLLNAIDDVSFVPVDIDCIGNPCVEVGDRVEIIKSDNVSIETLVLKRTINGLQFLKDEIIAEGDETYPENVNGIQVDIKQLKGKSNVLERDIEQTRSIIRDVEQGLQTEIRQTADGLEIEIQDLQSQIDGEIEYYEREGTPTLLNYPYWDFTSAFKCDGTKVCNAIYNEAMIEGGDQYPHFYYSETDRKNHQRDLVFDSLNAVSYRFNKVEGEWIWQEIADSETSIILSRLSTLEATAETLQSEYSQISLELEDGYYTKNETNSLIQQSASSITQSVSSTYQTKSAMGDYYTKNQTDSKITQTSSSIMAQVSQGYAGKTGGSANSFSYELTSSKFELKANGTTVFKATSSGIDVIRMTGTSLSLGSLSTASLEITGSTSNAFKFHGNSVQEKSINNESHWFIGFTSYLSARYSAAAGGYVLTSDPYYSMSPITINSTSISGALGNTKVLTV